MRLITLDLETFFSNEHSLTKMSPMAYCMHPETEIISLAIKVDHYPTDVFFGEPAIRKALKGIENVIADSMVVGHNLSGFDSMILAWRLGMRPKMWGCTLAMARPIHGITTGLSLGKLVAHYGLGVKDQTALMNTKGRHLCDFTPQEIKEMGEYNKADVEQCYALFHKLKPHYSAKELWHIDATIRMLVEPRFDVNVPMLEAALCMERDQKRKHILQLARRLRTNDMVEASEAVSAAESIEDLEEAVRAELASAPKFSAILKSLGVDIPMKPSPTVEGTQIPALAKTDEGFIALQEHENELVAAAARARLAVKSTLLETRIQKFLDTAATANGKLPIPTNYCGAIATGRRSGSEFNALNLPRVTPGKPKVSDALRNCITAPKGYKIAVADLSGIEMRFNHTLWQVPTSMNLWKTSPTADLYKATASEMYGVPESEVTKAQRQFAKVLHLACGYGMGPKKFKDAARIMGGMTLSDEESADGVAKWRALHPEIVAGWRRSGDALKDMLLGVETPVDPWGLFTTCQEGFRLPSGRVIRYPELRKEHTLDGKTEWWYGTGRHKARIYSGKCVENLCQAGSRDVMYDYILEVFKQTGFRPSLEVYDEGVWVVPEAEAQEFLDAVQSIMRTPPKWFPALQTWSEGDIADTYGAAK